jgi:hypothetical protein
MSAAVTKPADTVTIGELLKGCTPGPVQTVGYMAVVPLLSDLHDDRFAAPTAARIATASYGTVRVSNREDKPILLPHGATYIVSEKAQNHAIPHVSLVKARASAAFDTAMCVQQSQGGMISEDQHALTILPVVLREQGHAARKTRNFQRLWPAIQKFNERAGIVSGGGHLEKFFEKFEVQLEQFVAEFEPLDNQVGAIVLINGKVAGVERCPSANYFHAIWRPLVRECYGSMAVLEHQNGPATVPKTRAAVREARSLDDLELALAEAESTERKNVAALVNSLAALPLSRTTDEPVGATVDALAVDGLGGVGTDSFVGQAVRDGAQVIYASVVAREQWKQKDAWLFAAPFAM